jgi:phosphodiesterase/alkaline phosphatase D-like protein
VTPISATLNGTVNPNGLSTTYCFQWGTTTAYGKITPFQSAGSGTGNVSVSANLTGLTPNTIYHYRLAAANSNGTNYGADSLFKKSFALPFLMLLLLN